MKTKKKKVIHSVHLFKIFWGKLKGKKYYPFCLLLIHTLKEKSFSPFCSLKKKKSWQSLLNEIEKKIIFLIRSKTTDETEKNK